MSVARVAAELLALRLQPPLELRDDAMDRRKVLQLSIAFDHRICDGGEAAGFLRFVADCVESPTTMLANL